MAIDNRVVAANISKLRNHRGMTQFQLAAAVNVSHQAVSKWETGAALPDIQTLLALTQIFGVTMEELLNTEIVIREEETPDEAEQPQTDETVFPGFLNDLIPEEAKKAIKNAAGEARKTFIEMSGELSSRAEKTFSKAVEFAQKAKKDVEGCFQEAKKAPEETEKCKKEPERQAPKESVSFEKLSRMAPFMSREKLSELVLRYSEDVDLESIVQIAPFLTRATVQKLIEKCMDKKADHKVISRLAPFASADALYQLILANLEGLDWKTLEGLAPFLKRPMVDALAEYAITGVKPEKTAPHFEPQCAKETFKDAVKGVMGEIGNMVSEIESVAKSIFTPRQEAQEEPAAEEECAVSKENEIPGPLCTEEIEKFIPSMEEIEKFIPADIPLEKAEETVDETARRALEDGNWSFIKDRANEIADESLLCEIARAAVSAVSQADGAAIIMKIAPRLSDEERQSLFEKVAIEEAWELAVALRIFADEENAKTIIEKAALAEGADREEAYLALECYAKTAPRDVLEKIAEKAVREDNWVLINALRDAY